MKTRDEKKLSIDRELLQLWRLCNGLEETLKAVKKSVKRVETARYQQKQELLSSPEKEEEVEGWRSDAELRNDIVKAKLEIEKEEPTQEFTKEELKYLRQIVDVGVTLSERVGEKRITDMAKRVLSKIERLLK